MRVCNLRTEKAYRVPITPLESDLGGIVRVALQHQLTFLFIERIELEVHIARAYITELKKDTVMQNTFHSKSVIDPHCAIRV